MSKLPNLPTPIATLNGVGVFTEHQMQGYANAALSDFSMDVFGAINSLRWLLNITTEFDRKDIRTRQAARLLDEITNSFGETNRVRLEHLWKRLNDQLPTDGRVMEYLRAHDAASRSLREKAKPA